MKRLIDSQLSQWALETNRKPLIVKGARQIGKSWSITELGKSFKGGVHTINLEQRPDWHSVFDPNLDAKRILSEFEVLLNRYIVPGEDLLFFDEIQACPKAIQSLRYFYEQVPALHVISAGSLLEFALKDIPFPVGRVQILDMFPMNFAEYLEANGQSVLKERMLEKPHLLSAAIHQKLLDEVRNYFSVGGMPACVSQYVERGSILRVRNLQQDLLATFRQDFLKYTPFVNTQCLQEVLTSSAQQIGQQISYTKLSTNFTGPTNKKAFDLLTTSKLLHKIPSVSPLDLPLSSQVNSKKFKAVFLDIGLLTALRGIPAEYTGDYYGVFRGSIAEQFVGQELIASQKGEVYFWVREMRNSQSEIDYLISTSNEIKPIEVKSGASGRMRSLHRILADHPFLTRGYVLSEQSYAELPEQKLVYLPIYYAGTV
ncbi:MAG: ATP-binding protein [Saprospiraceae bacterium]|nr:ATP-binding protein [Saprospiraceae bacterium]